MTISTSRKAFDDCYDALDRALKATRGIRISVESKTQAMTLITRLGRARQIDRDTNTAAYPDGDPRGGVSDYDTLIIRAPQSDNGWWVHIEKRQIIGKVEELEPHASDAGRRTTNKDHAKFKFIRR